MAWFRTQENMQRPLVVALEGISPDLLQVQLSMLEQELHTAGVVVRRLAFPTQKAAEHVPALFQAPELEQLRTAYVEAANLFPKTKIVSASREGLLKPDSDIGNEVWNLVRRIVLKTDIPQR